MVKKIGLDIQYDDESKTSAIVYVCARLNQHECQFILDTGCRTSLLFLSDFSRGLVKIGENESSGLVGTESFDLVNIQEVEFGPILKHNVLFSRFNGHKIDKNLLGMDVLKGSSILLSYEKGELIFNERPSGLALEAIFPDPRGNQPYISIKCQGQELKALWDTGAGITIVDINFIKKNPDIFELIGESVGTDSTGNKVVTPNYKIKSLEINGHQFNAHEIAAIDKSHINSKSGNPVLITLGFSTIKQADWFFDFNENKWAVARFHG